MKTRFLPRIISFLALVLVLAGCATHPMGDVVVGPSYLPDNIYSRDPVLPVGFRRVAVLPLVSGERGALMLEPVLQRELGQAARFEVVIVTCDMLRSWTGRPYWPSTEPVPADLLARLSEQLNCDGVLFAEVSQFHAYPPLLVGWKLKLAETGAGRVIWAADEVFDAGRAEVANGARRFQLERASIRPVRGDSRFILLSPTVFGEYSAQTLLQALPYAGGAKPEAKCADTMKGNKTS